MWNGHRKRINILDSQRFRENQAASNVRRGPRNYSILQGGTKRIKEKETIGDPSKSLHS